MSAEELLATIGLSDWSTGCRDFSVRASVGCDSRR
jgi:hypothetical protein